MYNILNFGAIADGKTLNSKAIQNAIDECAKNGGGKVVVPAGNYYCGTIWLKDNVELHLESGANLIASMNLDDYNDSDAYPQNWDGLSEHWLGKHLIIAHEVKNVSITGHGIIDGCGDTYWGRIDKNLPWQEGYVFRDGFTRTKDLKPSRPGQVICFIECENVKVTDITIQNCPCWACFFHGCEMVQVRGLKVLNPSTYANTDGIDIDCCRFVTVSDCILLTGDDAIAVRCSSKRLKKYRPCEFVSISNCVLSSSACGVRIGVGKGELKNIRISGLVIKSAGYGIWLRTRYGAACEGKIENVHISDVLATGVSFPLTVESDAGYAKNIKFTNMRFECVASSKIVEMEGGEVSDITFKDIDFVVQKEEGVEFTENKINRRGEYVLTVNKAKNVTLDGVRVIIDENTLSDWKGKFIKENAENLTIKNCEL